MMKTTRRRMLGLLAGAGTCVAIPSLAYATKADALTTIDEAFAAIGPLGCSAILYDAVLTSGPDSEQWARHSLVLMAPSILAVYARRQVSVETLMSINFHHLVGVTTDQDLSPQLRKMARRVVDYLPGGQWQRGANQYQATLDSYGYSTMQVTKALGHWANKNLSVEDILAYRNRRLPYDVERMLQAA